MTLKEQLPRIIQGGMGIGVSNWRLARVVARAGQLGVVSGTGLAVVLIRRLQLGDPGGHMRRALAAFPYPDVARHLLDAYFIPGGKPADAPYKLTPLPRIDLSDESTGLTVAANFCEVWLAREGHDRPVGINYLEKIQLVTLPSLYGALLAGVATIIMGGGIPLAIPGVLDRLTLGQPVSLRMQVDGETAEQSWEQPFDPRDLGAPPAVRRPQFYAIVSSETVAKAVLRRSSGQVDGLVVEHHSAGGHNAPPRRAPEVGSGAAFGPRDEPDIARIAALGAPFWLGGGYGSPARLAEALALGAAGVQVGSPFAHCRESGFTPEIKRAFVQRALAGQATIDTDLRASPTGYPFKLTRELSAAPRERRPCDVGYLRQPYVRADGNIGYRCPAEPVAAYVAKGGLVEDTVGRRCLCNGLLAAIGLAQTTPAGEEPAGSEPPLVTSGTDLSWVGPLVARAGLDYGAGDVLAWLLS
jgi:NAD(P)H-dependent flavin oxidoreductase YrpB (nitropropane dioxygenase family)